ncbi:unnamed protein product [Boreogadus saida]
MVPGRVLSLLTATRSELRWAVDAPTAPIAHCFGVAGSRPHLRNVIVSEDQRYTIKRSNHPLTTYIAPWPVDLCSAGKSQATRELRGEDLPRDSVSAAVKRSSIA